jgi:hypothetical protein
MHWMMHDLNKIATWVFHVLLGPDWALLAMLVSHCVRFGA